MKAMTFTDFQPYLTAKPIRRFNEMVIRQRTHCFFSYKGIIYGVQEGTQHIYRVTSTFEPAHLITFRTSGKLLDNVYVSNFELVLRDEVIFDADAPKCKPVVNTALAITVHTIDRIRERSPIFLKREDASITKYVVDAIKAASDNGNFFITLEDSATFYIHKQYVWVVTPQGVIKTTMRLNKLHKIALKMYKATQTKVPTMLVSKQTKEFLLGV